MMNPDGLKNTNEQMTYVQRYTSTECDTLQESSDDSDNEESFIRNAIRQTCNSIVPTTIYNLAITNSQNVHVGPKTTVQINGQITVKNKVINIIQQENSVLCLPESNTVQHGQLQINEQLNNPDIGPSEIPPRFIPRFQWLAQPATQQIPLECPVRFVIISQTSTETSDDCAKCIFLIRNIQSIHMDALRWNDIGYNFIVGGDGYIYEGRGWNLVGEQSCGCNKNSIGVALLGTFRSAFPSQLQLKTLNGLLVEGLKLGKIRPDYTLLTQGQVSLKPDVEDALIEIVQKLDHFSFDTSHYHEMNESEALITNGNIT